MHCAWCVCLPFSSSRQEEFNFEEALKKFNKEALEKEAEEEHVSGWGWGV